MEITGKICPNTQILPSNFTVGHFMCPFVGKLTGGGYLCKHLVNFMLQLYDYCTYSNLIMAVQYVD